MKTACLILAFSSMVILPTRINAATSYGYTTLEGVTSMADFCTWVIKTNTVKNKYITAPAEVHLTTAESNLCK